MARDTEANLRARKWPVNVAYLPTRMAHPRCPYRITFARDTQQGDVIGGAVGAHPNPRQMAVRRIGVVVEVFVRLGLEGALRGEHEHACDDLVDALQTALDQWATAARTGPLEYTEARYLSDEEIDEADRGAGVVYRIRFRVARGVAVRDYGGAARETATLMFVGNASEGVYVIAPNGAREQLPEPPEV